MRWILVLLVAARALLPDSTVSAQPGDRVIGVSAAIVRMPVRKDSRLWLEGSSNVRDWTCRATTIDATIELDTSGQAPVVRNVAVNVPVRSLKCGDRHMEAHMYTALKAPASSPAFISAHFDRLPQMSASGQNIEIPGRLTISGVERAVVMSVRSERLPDGSYRARGTVPIKMTDFDIKPPKPWGGILRTANQVLVQFEIFLAADI